MQMKKVNIKHYTLQFLGKLYSELGWTMQLHIAAIRNNNTKMFKKLGPDTGFDSINDEANSLSTFKIIRFIRSRIILFLKLYYIL